MEENRLTVKEIFEQITILQKQLTENSQTSLHRLGDIISDANNEDSGNGDALHESVADICDVFKTRELTLLKMLEMYEKMYDDIQNEKSQKVDMISRAFDKNMAFISDSDIQTEDKYAALSYVTDKIAELVGQIIADKED